MVGEQIKKRRIELGLTQAELAKRLGYKSNTTINKIELGINDIAQSKVVEFAKALETTPAYIMGWDSLDYVAEEDREMVKWALKNNLAPIELPEKIQALNVLLHQYKYDIVAREGGEYSISYDFAEGASGMTLISDEEISEIIDSTSKHLELVTYNVVRRILDRYNNSNIDTHYPEQKDLP